MCGRSRDLDINSEEMEIEELKKTVVSFNFADAFDHHWADWPSFQLVYKPGV